MKITVYTDGSGTTGGPAGIAYYALRSGRPHRTNSMPLRNATNQQAEILAAALALHELEPGEITVVSDSEYLVKGWNEYLPVWRANGWRKRTGGTPKNIRHWERLIAASERHLSVTFRWTRGHAGTHGNEEADRMAGEARAVAIRRANEEESQS